MDVVHLWEREEMDLKLFLSGKTATNLALWSMSLGMLLASGMNTHDQIGIFYY